MSVKMVRANKMQIQQRWIIPQSILYSKKKTENKKYYEDARELENGKVRFRLNIYVKKEEEDWWLNGIKI